MSKQRISPFARVQHPRFGLGWVRGKAGDRLFVVFDEGSSGWVLAAELTVVPQDGDPYTAVADAVAELAVRYPRDAQGGESRG
jgi:hypothetical protein